MALGEKNIDEFNAACNQASASTSKFAATLKTVGANMLIMAGVSLALKGLAKAWDTLNVTVEEQEAKINDLKTSYEGLKSEYDELSQKQDVTDAEKRRLEYLERRLELDERILKAEQAQLFDEKTGNKFTDLFDKDNLNTQALAEKNFRNKEGYTGQRLQYTTKMDDIDDLHKQVAEWKELQANVKKGSDVWNSYQKAIDKAQEKETKYIDQLSKMETQLTINWGRYADNIEYLQSQLDSGELTKDQEATAKEQLAMWKEWYDETDLMITQIQKRNGTYSIETKLNDILSKDKFQETSKQLQELGKSGELSIETLSSRFPELIKYLEEAGISAEELYQHIMALSDPDAVNLDALHEQAKVRFGGYSYSSTGSMATNEAGRTFDEFWKENIKTQEQADLVNSPEFEKVLQENRKKLEEQNQKMLAQYNDAYNKSVRDFDEASKELYERFAEWNVDDTYIQDQLISDAKTGRQHNAKYGNIDMNKRAIIEWSNELKETYKQELESWAYDPELGSVDTVFNHMENFKPEGSDTEYSITFSPILQTDNGGVLLSHEAVQEYINSVLAKAGEDGNIDADEIIQIDAEGTGYKVGENYVKGIIAAFADDATGITSLFDKENENAVTNDALYYQQTMGFDGNYGSLSMSYKGIGDAKQSMEELKKSTQDAAYSTEELVNAVKTVGAAFADANFEQARAELIVSEDEAVKGLNDDLLELAEQGRLTEQTFNNADSTGYFKSLNISADEAIQKINALVDESKQLSSMSSQISAMSNALGTKLSDGFVDADTLSGFDVEVRGLESWDRFQNVLGSTTSSYQECQEAANALATEWVNSSDFLAQLTEQNKEYYETQLEAMGIENYEDVIESTLALKEAKEALIDVNLSDATYEDIEALISEGEYSALTTEQIWSLYYAKLAESETFLDSSADCQAMLNLANDTNMTAEAVSLLTQLMSIYNGLESGAYNGNRALREEALAEATRIKTELENLAKGEGEGLIAKPQLKVGNGGAKKSGSGGSGSSKDAWKEQYEKELKELERLHKLGLISDAEYWQKRLDLNERYFGESSGMHEKYLDEYQDNEEEILEGLKKLWEDFYNERKDNLKDLISYAEKLYDREIDSLDAEIEKLEEKRDAEKKYWQAKIDEIGDEIDALEDANDERQKAINLQQKQFALQKAMHMRTMLINLYVRHYSNIVKESNYNG